MILIGRIPTYQEKAIAFFSDFIMSRRVSRFLIIRIVYRKNINFLGSVEVLETNSRKVPREFILEMKTGQSKEEYLRTLAHEMIHIKQYALGELNEEMSLWHGKKHDSEKIPYAKQPWEIEAHDLSEILLAEYYRSL